MARRLSRGETFTLRLASHLRTVPIPAGLKREDALERVLRSAVRAFTAKFLGLKNDALDNVVYSHGDDRREKALWTGSKPLQNVVVYGCANTSDIFITHPKIGSVYIEVKLSKARSRSATSLPGDLQRSVGQSLIASLRHAHVICFIGVQGVQKKRPQDLGARLRRTLWKNHNVALVVRSL